MKYLDLYLSVQDLPVFTYQDVLKLFPSENENTLKVQLSKWTSRGKLERLRRGVYCLRDIELPDPFVLTSFLYSPAYISCETALNVYGMIPDVPNEISLVTPKNTREFHTGFGLFRYRSISSDYFFGFKKIEIDSYSYLIAVQEKALLDFIYYLSLEKRSLEEIRLTLPEDLSHSTFTDYAEAIRTPRIKPYITKIENMLKERQINE